MFLNPVYGMPQRSRRWRDPDLAGLESSIYVIFNDALLLYHALFFAKRDFGGRYEKYSRQEAQSLKYSS